MAGLGWLMALGGGSATPKGQTHFFKKIIIIHFGPWGGQSTPQGPRGGFGHPRQAVWGGRSHPFAILGHPLWDGWPLLIFFFNFF
jgi:hypothetical protein